MKSTAEAILTETPVAQPSINRKKLWIATGGHFTTDLYNGFLAPLLPIIVVKLDLSLALAGLLLSIFSISNSLLQPLAGMLSDRMNRSYFILFGPVIAGTFMGFIGWVNQYWTLILILVGSGIGTSIFHPQSAALVGGLDHRRKGLSMSVYSMAGALGVSVGSIIIVPLTNQFGLKASIVTIVPAYLLFFYSFNFLRENVIRTEKRKINTNLMAAIKANWIPVLMLHIIVVIRAILIVSFSGFIPLFLTSQGETPFFGGLALAVFQIFATIGILAGGHVYDRIGPRKTLILSFMFILPLGLLTVNVAPGWALPCLATMGFMLTFSTPVNIILGQQIVPQNAGFMSALMMGFAWGVAGLLMTPVGAIADIWGLQVTLTAISFVALLGLILVMIIPFRRFTTETR